MADIFSSKGETTAEVTSTETSEKLTTVLVTQREATNIAQRGIMAINSVLDTCAELPTYVCNGLKDERGKLIRRRSKYMSNELSALVSTQVELPVENKPNTTEQKHSDLNNFDLHYADTGSTYYQHKIEDIVTYVCDDHASTNFRYEVTPKNETLNNSTFVINNKTDEAVDRWSRLHGPKNMTDLVKYIQRYRKWFKVHSWQIAVHRNLVNDLVLYECQLSTGKNPAKGIVEKEKLVDALLTEAVNLPGAKEETKEPVYVFKIHLVDGSSYRVKNANELIGFLKASNFKKFTVEYLLNSTIKNFMLDIHMGYAWVSYFKGAPLMAIVDWLVNATDKLTSHPLHIQPAGLERPKYLSLNATKPVVESTPGEDFNFKHGYVKLTDRRTNTVYWPATLAGAIEMLRNDKMFAGIEYGEYYVEVKEPSKTGYTVYFTDNQFNNKITPVYVPTAYDAVKVVMARPKHYAFDILPGKYLPCDKPADASLEATFAHGDYVLTDKRAGARNGFRYWRNNFQDIVTLLRNEEFKNIRPNEFEVLVKKNIYPRTYNISFSRDNTGFTVPANTPTEIVRSILYRDSTFSYVIKTSDGEEICRYDAPKQAGEPAKDQPFIYSKAVDLDAAKILKNDSQTPEEEAKKDYSQYGYRLTYSGNKCGVLKTSFWHDLYALIAFVRDTELKRAEYKIEDKQNRRFAVKVEWFENTGKKDYSNYVFETADEVVQYASQYGKDKYEITVSTLNNI